jgi:hypothetical protein
VQQKHTMREKQVQKYLLRQRRDVGSHLVDLEVQDFNQRITEVMGDSTT